MKLKVGDKVRILGADNSSPARVGWVSNMNYSIGLETRIIKVNRAFGGHYYYNLNIDRGRWNYDADYIEKIK